MFKSAILQRYQNDIDQVSLGGLPCLVCCDHRANRGGLVNFFNFQIGKGWFNYLDFKTGEVGIHFSSSSSNMGGRV